MKKSAFSLAFASLLSIFCLTASADIVVLIRQVGDDVVVTSEGSVDLSNLTPMPVNAPILTSLIPSAVSSNGFDIPAAVATGPRDTPAFDSYEFFSVTGPNSFGDAGTILFTAARRPDVGDGDVHGFSLPGSPAGTVILVPANYSSGDELVSQMTFESKTIGELGLDRGTYDWSYGVNSVNLVIGVPGDANLDGEVDFLDISAFIAILSSGDYLAEADVNSDGVVNFLDIAPFIDILLQQ